jgi:hypothetical protein
MAYKEPTMSIFPKSTFPDPEQLEMERVQKAKRWQELSKRFGAAPNRQNPYLCPEDERSFVRQLEQLDYTIAHPTYLTVHAYLGYPIVKPRVEIKPDNLADELDALLEYLHLNYIAVDFLCDVSDEEAYRFIVDELLDENIEDMRGTGMTTHFIYEEFHPNAEYDAKMWAKNFLSSLLHHHPEWVKTALSKDELYDRRGRPTTRTTFLQQVDTFLRRHPTIIDIQIDALTCQIDGDYAAVEVATTWTDVQSNPPDRVKIVGRSHLRLKRNDDYWEVIQAQVPGWD